MKSALFHLYIILKLSYTSCCPASQFKTVKWVFGQMVHNGNADAVAQHVGHSPETVPVGKHRADWSWEDEFISYTSLKLYLWHCNMLNSAYRSFRFFFSLTPVASTFCYKQLKESSHSNTLTEANQQSRAARCLLLAVQPTSTPSPWTPCRPVGSLPLRYWQLWQSGWKNSSDDDDDDSGGDYAWRVILASWAQQQHNPTGRPLLLKCISVAVTTVQPHVTVSTASGWRFYWLTDGNFSLFKAFGAW